VRQRFRCTSALTGDEKWGQASEMTDGMEDWMIIIWTGWRRKWGMRIWDPPQYSEGKAMVRAAGRRLLRGL